MDLTPRTDTASPGVVSRSDADIATLSREAHDRISDLSTIDARTTDEQRTKIISAAADVSIALIDRGIRTARFVERAQAVDEASRLLKSLNMPIKRATLDGELKLAAQIVIEVERIAHTSLIADPTLIALDILEELGEEDTSVRRTFARVAAVEAVKATRSHSMDRFGHEAFETYVKAMGAVRPSWVRDALCDNFKLMKDDQINLVAELLSAATLQFGDLSRGLRDRDGVGLDEQACAQVLVQPFLRSQKRHIRSDSSALSFQYKTLMNRLDSLAKRGQLGSIGMHVEPYIRKYLAKLNNPNTNTSVGATDSDFAGLLQGQPRLA
jgi:hypothetical protein